jgi:prevent-host-death family protein
MSESFDVAEAKSRFSELLNRAAYGRERFVIRKRGKPVAAIVSTEDLTRLEQPQPEPSGLLGAAGCMADFPEWADIMEEVVRERHERFDERQVDLD